MRGFGYHLFLVLVLLLPGCRHGLLRKPCKDDECESDRRLPSYERDDPRGLRLGEPIPNRIPPSRVPLRTDDFPSPEFDTERRFRNAPKPPNEIPLSESLYRERPAQVTYLEAPIASEGSRWPERLKDREQPILGDLPPRSQSPLKSSPILSFAKSFPDRSNAFLGPIPNQAQQIELKKQNITTLLLISEDKADIASVQNSLEANGFIVVPLVVQPELLSDASKIFNEAMASKKPLYVADTSRIRGGFLTYLYLRQVVRHNDEAAKLLATPLGLPSPTDADAVSFWIATQAALNP